MKNLRSRLTFSNLVAVIALFIAVGGSAYAALSLPKNSVGSKQLKLHAVTSTKIKPGSLSAADLSPGAISVLHPVTSYSETESDARYLRGTITEVKSFKLGEGSGESSSAQVSCPKGYQAVGGGVDVANFRYDKVSASTPTFAGRRPEEFIGQGEHQLGPADGWFGAITVQGFRESSPFDFDEVVVICSPIG